MINTETWMEYKIDYLFNISRGKRYKKSDHEDGNINYISSKDSNNGVDALVLPPDNFKVYKNVLGINNSGSVGKVFYHKSESVFSDHVTILDLKDNKLNENIAMFLIPIIEKIRLKYQFGREMNNSRLKEEVIMLPSINNMPNWEYMENFVLSLKNINILPKTEYIQSQNNDKSYVLNINEWKEVRLADYFDMKAGKYYSKDSYSIGQVPLVSTSDKNNGILDYTNLNAVFPKNSITIGKVGCATFYQDRDFVASPDVTVLLPKFNFLNKYNGIFISRVISMEKSKWTYGRQIRLGDCLDLVIKLPVIDGVPDWEYMCRYIQSLPFTKKI